MRNLPVKGPLLFLIMVFVPFFLSIFYVNLLTEIFILGVFALSLNILVGQTGMVSLGHAAFFGAGAYAAGLAAIHVSTNTFLSIAAGLLAAFLLAVIIGLFSTKANGFYFLMLTLACSQIVYSIIYQWRTVTGGSNGLTGIAPIDLGANIVLSNQVWVYYFILVVFTIVLFLINRFLHSPLGSVLIGIRENEERMKSIGYNTALYKNISFIIAGTLGGLSGSLYVIFNGFISPAEVYWTASGSVLIMVLIGGAGTLWGPVIGAAFIVILETLISSYMENWMMIIGAVFIIFVIFAPDGMVGIFNALKKFFVQPKKLEVDADEPIIKPIKQETKMDG
ncbi:branched-chain amino acid ABC transporter permease [Neobacillus rhizophilus]|uniref:Branched-chain amino acid ABC transporter permease n=1 Tax=Neobacillus rhizophilus TaxID=2833579 RepID=A0A942U7F9_9BACI|nr:branched-chain amino acid ABC transporter permease [Neobacillus rhizophilus]MBS4214327.1 branched-chain amino acid ABC transporter permease [Neobacillus rhizophilus]